jgi:hypothetical protein
MFDITKYRYDTSSPSGLVYARVDKVGRAARRLGMLAGSLDPKGYWMVAQRVDGRYVRRAAHRVVFELLRGPIPEGLEVDHINGERGDNRIENLRLASSSQNKHNAATRRNNKLGVHGVHQTPGGKYRAKLAVAYRLVLNKDFDTLEEAASARRAAELRFHGSFAAHLRP